MGGWDSTNSKNFFQGSRVNGGMVTLGIDRDINPLYILFYFKKMLQYFIEHVWSLTVSDTVLLSDKDYLFIYYLGLYHVTEGLVFSVQNMKHTGLGTKLTFSKSVPIRILALVSTLLTRLLSPLIHENTKSIPWHALAIHRSDCFIFPRMDQ